MKSRLITVLMIVLMSALSSQAFAYYANNDLIEVVYNGTSAERAIDLGSLTTLNLDKLTSPLTLAGANSINLTALQASSFSDLRVGFFAFSGTGSYQEYFATTMNTTPAINTSSMVGFGSAYSSVANYYTSFGTQIVDASTSNANTYVKKMDQNSTAPGAYSSFNKVSQIGEASLAALDQGGSVTMYLYHFNMVSAAAGALGTPYSAILTLNANGSTTAQATTPIPASILLFGSGLLGLVGLKRKGAETAA